MHDPSPTPAVAERPTQVRWLIFALACGMSFLLYLHRYTWGFIRVELQREFDWDAPTMGWLDSAFNLTYAAGQIPGGILGDWYGPRKVLVVMSLVWSLAMGGMALARGFYPLAAVRAVFGLAQAGCYPNLSKVTKVWFPLSERTAVQGWVASFFGRMGGAASFILVGTLMLGTWHLPWRTALGWLAVLGLAFVALFVLLFRNSPRQHPFSNAAEAELVTTGDPSAAIAARSAIRWRLVFRNRYVWALLFQQFTCAFVDNFFSNWLPTFLTEVKHVEMAKSGWMSALPLVGGALGGMLAGGLLQSWLIRRTKNRRWSRSAVGLVGNLLAGVCLYTSLLFENSTAIVVCFFCLKFFADWAQPTCWGAATDMGGRNSASLFALVNTSGSLAGFAAGPAMGYTIQWFGREFGTGEPNDPAGWTALLVGIGIVYVLSALSWLFIDCTQTIDDENA
ncbi:MAG: MFS transporter [Planctomycetaceae bacterium]|nr:MFS transporter [Planctomycetaceae bacterium]